MPTPTIDLSDSVGLGVIIAFPSGVKYSNQTGGTTCLRPELEGVFVPLRNDYLTAGREFISPEIALSRHFEGPKWRGAGAIRGIDTEDADLIDSILTEHRLGECLHINRERLSESHEAWIHVSVLSDEPTAVFRGFRPFPKDGVLTWANSD